PADDTHVNVHPMRRLNASSLLNGARETATRVTSRAARCTTPRSKLSAPERAALAPLLPVGCEHEMVDDQLRTPGEQVAERDLAVRSVEHVRLVDAHPR